MAIHHLLFGRREGGPPNEWLTGAIVVVYEQRSNVIVTHPGRQVAVPEEIDVVAVAENVPRPVARVATTDRPIATIGYHAQPIALPKLVQQPTAKVQENG